MKCVFAIIPSITLQAIIKLQKHFELIIIFEPVQMESSRLTRPIAMGGGDQRLLILLQYLLLRLFFLLEIIGPDLRREGTFWKRTPPREVKNRYNPATRRETRS